MSLDGYPDLDKALAQPELYDPENVLGQGLRNMQIDFTPAQQAQLSRFLTLLQHWNKAFNLTAIRDPQAMVVYHLLDSLAIRPWLYGDEILDIGTGAGLPGLPLAIMAPEQRFVLLDSNGKKIRFVRQVILALALENVTLVHERISSYQPEHRFTTVLGRAVAAEVMLSAAQKLLAPKSRMLLMTGPEPEAQVCVDYANQLQPLTVTTTQVYSLTVPWLHAPRHVLAMDIG